MCPLKISPLMCCHTSLLIAVSPFYESLYFHRMLQLVCSCQQEPRWQVRQCPWANVVETKGLVAHDTNHNLPCQLMQLIYGHCQPWYSAPIHVCVRICVKSYVWKGSFWRKILDDFQESLQVCASVLYGCARIWMWPLLWGQYLFLGPELTINRMHWLKDRALV